MFRPLCVLLMAGALFGAPAAQAEILHFVALDGLTGPQESPPVDSPATGTGVALFDTDTLMLTVHLTWENLVAPAVASHIHVLTPPDLTGPVAVDFVPVGFPSDQTGEFHHTFDLDNAASYGGAFLASFGGDVDAARAAVIAGLIEGRAYFNIHSTQFPAGEIRGNITLIPEPTTLALLGLGAVAALIRRRYA